MTTKVTTKEEEMDYTETSEYPEYRIVSYYGESPEEYPYYRLVDSYSDMYVNETGEEADKDEYPYYRLVG